MALGHTIRKLRKQRNWSQDKLSEMTGFIASQGAISNLEKRDSASSEFTAVIAKALGVSVSEILGYDEDVKSCENKSKINIYDLSNRVKELSLNEIIRQLSVYLDMLDDNHKPIAGDALNRLVDNPNLHKTVTSLLLAVIQESKKTGLISSQQ